MWAIVFAGISTGMVPIAFGLAYMSKKHERKCRELYATIQNHDKFTKWAMGTRIVVRDKLSHEQVTNVTLYTLYTQFQNGEAFRGAKMLFDNTEFKVYVQEKGE